VNCILKLIDLTPS